MALLWFKAFVRLENDTAYNEGNITYWMYSAKVGNIRLSKTFLWTFAIWCYMMPWTWRYISKRLLQSSFNIWKARRPGYENCNASSSQESWLVFIAKKRRVRWTPLRVYAATREFAVHRSRQDASRSQHFASKPYHHALTICRFVLHFVLLMLHARQSWLNLAIILKTIRSPLLWSDLINIDDSIITSFSFKIKVETFVIV